MDHPPDPDPPARCQVCGQPLTDCPIWLAASPDGRSAWAMHYDIRDCVRALQPRPHQREVAHGHQ